MISQSHIHRQLTDVQMQGQRLLRGNAEMEDWQAFVRYSAEMKNFLITAVDDPEIVDLATSIPEIDAESESVNTWPVWFTIILAIVTLSISFWWSSYLAAERQKEHLRQNASHALSIYAQIDWVLRSKV